MVTKSVGDLASIIILNCDQGRGVHRGNVPPPTIPGDRAMGGGHPQLMPAAVSSILLHLILIPLMKILQ